jgi:hypothetical protein
MRYMTIVGMVTIAAALTACGKKEETQEPMTPASRISPAAQDTAERIASASCDREQRCNRIGDNAKYGTREHCMNVMREDARSQLDSSDCEHEIDQNDVQECLTEINNEDCGGPVDKLEQLVACRTDDLCD